MARRTTRIVANWTTSINPFSCSSSPMADVQNYFEEFDQEIRLGRFDQEETLREKRDRIRDRLKEKLPEVFESHDEEVHDFYFEDQVSYEMGTAIEAIHGDIDIDQGLYVHVSTDEYDPVVLKERVYTSEVGAVGHDRQDPNLGVAGQAPDGLEPTE